MATRNLWMIIGDALVEAGIATADQRMTFLNAVLAMQDENASDDDALQNQPPLPLEEDA